MTRRWAPPPEDRYQMVLYSRRLDDAIRTGHPVRLLDEILGRLPWGKWEARYDSHLGQPPIPPRVVAGVLLHGLMTGVRSSRRLEEALEERNDFRWLAEGRTIDHTTISEFRRGFGTELKDLFVQVALIARESELLPLTRLAFDGTRIKANNRRSGTRTPAELQKIRDELSQKFTELEKQAAIEDARQKLLFPDDERKRELPRELADVGRRRDKIDQALAALKKAEEDGEAIPKRVPLTDLQSRVSPNKDGGFSPSYTPLATVDVDTGFIVSVDVIPMTNEEQYLLAAVDDVKKQFGLEQAPPEMLADGLLSTGPILAGLEKQGVTMFSPVPDPGDNPALRDDPRQPVPPEQWAKLPTKTVRPRGSKETQKQLERAAFVYDAEQNCYWCPQGKALPYQGTTSQMRSGERIYRARYQAEATVCADCPLKALCAQGENKTREISRDQFEEHRERLAERMATPEGKETYKKRRHPGERPFAVIKQQFGARQFLLRGLEQVRIEWRWLATAFNLKLLLRRWRVPSGTAPPEVVPLA
jgi:transposase